MWRAQGLSPSEKVAGEHVRHAEGDSLSPPLHEDTPTSTSATWLGCVDTDGGAAHSKGSSSTGSWSKGQMPGVQN